MSSRRSGWLLIPLVASMAACPSATPPDPASDDDDATSPAPPEPLRFAFPVRQPWMINLVIGVDHDPVDHGGGGVGGGVTCTNYAGDGFPYCYDGHDGSDYILDGGFSTMDDGSADVIAAAPGVVISIEQDQYDRCHISGTAVTCDGHPVVANHVIIDHGDGVHTKYWHLMKDSVIVAVGDSVDCATPLALIGSSGNSSMPHLHFEVELEGVTFDPYGGPESQPESWWTEQDGPFDVPGSDCQ